MKNDINLLQKRKGKQYSSQKVATLLLAVALFAGSVYAGFTFPDSIRAQARLNAARLSDELVSATDKDKDLADLTELYATRSEQLDALTALDTARSDMGGYLDAVEKSLPTSANISSLSIAEQTLSITGVAADDDVVAIFCVRLRETGQFSSVFLQSSIAAPGDTTVFTMIAELPTTLDSSALLPEETEAPETSEEVTQ
jgi:Tfp pilus assembly protein PilN